MPARLAAEPERYRIRSSAPEAPKMDNALGTFPLTGPVTYLTDDARECRTLLQGARPPSRTWFHGTIEQLARIVCVQGIVPGCWLRDGSGACGVMGYDAPADFLQR